MGKFCRMVDEIKDLDEIDGKVSGPLDTFSVISEPDHSKKHRKVEIRTMDKLKQRVINDDRFEEGQYVLLVKEKSWKPNGWCHNIGDRCIDGYERSHRRDWEYSVEADVYRIEGD